LASPRRQPFGVLKEPHFWVILAIMTCGTIFYYADQIPWIDTVESSLRLDFARHSVHRILSILPVAYAAFVFGLSGGLLTSAVIAALLLPRVFLVSSEAEEAAVEVAAFLFIGTFVSWVIDMQNKEKARHKKTIASLEWAQGELQSHIQAIENEERRLSAINAVLGVVTESLELQDILRLALNKVSDVMGVEICLLFLLQEEAGELTLEAYRGISDESAAAINAIKPIKVGEGFNGRVAQTGEPLAVRDVSGDLALYGGVGGLGEVQTQLIVPLKSKGRVMGTLCAATRRLREFSSDEIEVLNAIGNAIGVAIENARLYQKERETAEQLRQSEENYRGLFENATEAIIVHNLDGRIIAANSACEKLTGYSRADMTRMDIDRLLSGEHRDTVKEIIKKLNGEAVEGPFELKLTKRGGAEAIVELMPSLIIRREKPIGVQAILRDVTEQRRMQENLRFYISQVLKAQEGERLRIARELHDDTAQALTGLSRRLDMLVDTLASSGNKVPKEIPERLEELREQSDRILEGVRRFSRDLRPPVLDDLGLLPAVKWLATALEEQQGIATNIRVLGEQHRLPDEAELALFRIAQEALNNVRKHSDATAVELTVDFRGGGIILIVADNGEGFEPPKTTGDLAASGKLGIIGMQERVRLLGGTLAVHSEPGGGTHLVVTVPAEASSLSSLPTPTHSPPSSRTSS
jgi:PAS domain S-box-containing protein